MALRINKTFADTCSSKRGSYLSVIKKSLNMSLVKEHIRKAARERYAVVPLKNCILLFSSRGGILSHMLRARSSSSGEDGHVVREPSSLREIQSCAGPRTKIFLCSVLSKRNKKKREKKRAVKEGRRDIVKRCGESVRERVSMREYAAGRGRQLLSLSLSSSSPSLLC